MKALANVNGKITPLEQASISILDRGFQYGDSVYEVTRTYQGIPFYLEEHFDRLEKSAHLCHMPISQSREELMQAIRQTAVEATQESKEDVFIRYIVTRGSGPLDLDPTTTTKTSFVIIVKSLPNWKSHFYTEGLSLYIPQIVRNSPLALSPNIKGGNYLNNILGLSEAKSAGYDDALFLSADFKLTESSNSNVLFIKGGQILSPKNSEKSHTGNLDGITKKIVKKISQKMGIPYIDQELTIDDLANIEECFITSATREVMPVQKIGFFGKEKLIHLQSPGKITSMLQKAYKIYTEEYILQNERKRWF